MDTKLELEADKIKDSSNSLDDQHQRRLLLNCYCRRRRHQLEQERHHDGFRGYHTTNNNNNNNNYNNNNHNGNTSSNKENRTVDVTINSSSSNSKCSNSMGKCVSKHPSAISLSLSTTDLATVNSILSKFGGSTDYISLKDEHGNQLYKYVGGESIIQQHHHHNHDHHQNDVAGDSLVLVDRSLCFDGEHCRLQTLDDANNNYKNKKYNRNNNNSSDDDKCTSHPHPQWASSGKKEKRTTNKNTTLLTNHKNILEVVDDGYCDDECRCRHFNYCKYVGQSESKKSSKKSGITVQTKGTAMSFGFRKKLNTTPKKTKKDKTLETIVNNKQQQEQFNDIITREVELDDGGTATVISNPNLVVAVTQQGGNSDNNGNSSEPTPVVTFEKVGAAGKSALAKPKHALPEKSSIMGGGEEEMRGEGISVETGGTAATNNRANRFGFKGTNTVRPASAGITPKYQMDFHDNLENNNMNQHHYGRGGASNNCNNNNNNNNNSTTKRRSKSAHSGRTMTPNLSDQQLDESKRHSPGSGGTVAPKINQKTITFNINHNSNEHQRRQLNQQQQQCMSAGRPPMPMPYLVNPPQYTFVNTGNHTNIIVRPTPKPPAVTFSKFTLQTTSLPKPEFPVPIRLNATAHSGTAGGSTTSTGASASTGARAKEITQSPSKQNHHNHQHHQPSHMDQKTAKQMANNTRRGFSGSREISADSGIASLDATLADNLNQHHHQQQQNHSSSSNEVGRDSSPNRSRSRPRNLQMVMNGRHKFEVRDLDGPLSSESLIVEPLALPKLPSAFSSDNQTVPLSGLVRSNTVLSRELFFRSTLAPDEEDSVAPPSDTNRTFTKSTSDDSEGVEEEKLFIDRSTSEKNSKKYQFKDLNTCSSKTSSPDSSRVSWCNAGESLAIKDFSSLSISSSDDSKDHQNEKSDLQNLPSTLNDDLICHSVMFSDIQTSSISSITESAKEPPSPLDAVQEHEDNNKFQESVLLVNGTNAEDVLEDDKRGRPNSLYNTIIDETKFAEIAAAGSEFLLDDETSPTDSLVSSTESEDAACKKQKRRTNEEIQEKDIDEISPELEVCSPVSPGTPTHASHSLSLSDCGRDFLIDDEIADQPALLFNAESTDGVGAETSSHKEHSLTDTPTLRETTSTRSLKSQSKARSALQAAIELSLRTPLSLRKAVLNRSESLDTLSPCESICSDDLMMDFDINSSSMDSIDKLSASLRSRSGSALNKLDDTQLFSELENRGSEMMKELSTILRVHTRNTDKDSIIAHLPARATRLLNRSRLQQCQLSNTGSDSPKSNDSFRRTPSRASSLHHSISSNRDTNSSSDDLMLYDKSFRNAMIQDVLHFKKQLLRLRRILQEDEEDCLTRTETLNPFDTDNGQLFASCGLDSKLLDDIDLASLTSSTTDDPLQELADLRRQGQVEDRDRTIRLQKNLIDKLESESGKPMNLANISSSERECINMATQTERTRPLSIGPDGLSRSKPEYTSYTTHFPDPQAADPTTTTTTTTIMQQHPTSNNASLSPLRCNQTRRHTIISTTFTNYNQISPSPRRASVGWEKATLPAPLPLKSPGQAAMIPTYKPVKITLIGDPVASSHHQRNGELCNAMQAREGSPKEQQLNNSYNIPATVVDVENRKNQQINGINNQPSNGNVNGKHYMDQNGLDQDTNILMVGKNHHHNHHKQLNGHQLLSQHHLSQHLNGTHFFQQHHKPHKQISPTVTIV